MSALKILVIPGSLRTGSLNARLAAAAAHEFALAGVEVTRISLGDFPLPIYDGDLQTKSGVPKNAVNLKRMMAAHGGVLIVTPEYNSSVPAFRIGRSPWRHQGAGGAAADPVRLPGQRDPEPACVVVRRRGL
jgi:chromate reductase